MKDFLDATEENNLGQDLSTVHSRLKIVLPPEALQTLPMRSSLNPNPNPNTSPYKPRPLLT